MLDETKLEFHLSAAIKADQHALTFAPARVVEFKSGAERYISIHEEDAHPLGRVLFELNSPAMPLYRRMDSERVGGFRSAFQMITNPSPETLLPIHPSILAVMS